MSCIGLAEQGARTEGEFVSMAAHELSQPLQTLELAWSAIQRHAPSDAEFGVAVTNGVKGPSTTRVRSAKSRPISCIGRVRRTTATWPPAGQKTARADVRSPIADRRMRDKR